MKYKALAIDLDGTLLIGEDLPPGHRDAVAKAYAAGYTVIIATARWRQLAQRIANEIGIQGAIIACSGAQVYIPDEPTNSDQRTDQSSSQSAPQSSSQSSSPKKGKDIFDHRLPLDFTQALYQICDSHRCIATATLDNETLLKLEGEPDPQLLSEELRWTEKLSGTEQHLPRITTVQGTAAINLIKSDLKDQFADTVNIYDSVGPSGKLILTMTAKAANKGHALSATCDYLGIDPALVIAFGDAENDLSMFDLAGASVAMGQADERIKAAATLVTSANTEDGVARVIDKLLATGDL